MSGALPWWRAAIDRWEASLPAHASKRPFTRAGSIWNLVLCAVLIALSVWFAVNTAWGGWIVAGLALALQLVFIAVAVHVWTRPPRDEAAKQSD